MNPLDALFLIMIAALISLVLAKLGIPGFTWKIVWILTLTISWLVINFSLWIEPPGNGTAYSVNFLFGWMYMLPVTAIFWLLQAVFFGCWPRLRSKPGFQRACRLGADLTLVLIVALFLYGTFGCISRESAIAAATRHASRQGLVALGTPHATWSWNRWSIKFGDDSGPFVDVSRTGALLGGRAR